MTTPARRGPWTERPFGATGRWVVLGLVAASIVADLAVFLLGEEREVGLPERIFGLVLAGVVATFAWRPTVAAIGLLVLLPLAEVADAEVMLRLTVPVVAGLVVATCGRAMVAVFAVVAFCWFAAAEIASPDGSVTFLVFLVVVGLGSGALGWFARRSGTQEEQLRRRVAEQELAIAHVRRLEQERIADELHDGIARQLTVIAMQAQVLSRTDDPELRAVSQQAVADSAARALSDVRRVLRLAGGPGGAEASESRTVDTLAPALAEIGTELPTAHVEVAVDEQAADALPPVLTTTLARVLRESVHNIRKHTGADPDVQVALVLDDAHAELTVSSAPHPGRPAPATAVQDTPSPEISSGYGLVRLDERVRALGGEFAAGPTDDGGWRVRASLPVS